MAVLTVTQLAQAGTEVTPVAADVAGDEFPIDTKTSFRIINGGGGSITVTVASQLPAEPGLTPEDLEVPVPAGESREILFSPSKPWADENGRAQITYDGVTDVDVAAVRA
jgi:hypothetical protein